MDPDRNFKTDLEVMDPSWAEILLRIRPDPDDLVGSGSGLNIEIQNTRIEMFSKCLSTRPIIEYWYLNYIYIFLHWNKTVKFEVGSGFSCGQIRTRFLLSFLDQDPCQLQPDPQPWPRGSWRIRLRNTNKQSKVWKTITWIFTYTVDILLFPVNGSSPIECAIYI